MLFTRPLGRVEPCSNLPSPCSSHNPPADNNSWPDRHTRSHGNALRLNSVSQPLLRLPLMRCEILLIPSFFSDYYWEQFDKNVTKRNMIGEWKSIKKCFNREGEDIKIQNMMTIKDNGEYLII